MIVRSLEISKSTLQLTTMRNENMKTYLLPMDMKYKTLKPTGVTTISLTCLDHVISCFPIEPKTVKVTLSYQYALQSELPILLKDNKERGNRRCCEGI